MQVSYDTAIHIAQDKIGNGEVKPDVAVVTVNGRKELSLTFHVLLPLSQIQEKEKGESNG